MPPAPLLLDPLLLELTPLEPFPRTAPPLVLDPPPLAPDPAPVPPLLPDPPLLLGAVSPRRGKVFAASGAVDASAPDPETLDTLPPQAMRENAATAAASSMNTR